MKSKTPNKIGEKLKSNKTPIVNKGVLQRVDEWLNKHHKAVFFFILGLNIVFVFLHFNLKISEANDDSMYIENAYQFARNFFGYYTPNAPFYPMMLSVIVRFFGINIFLLKLTSVFFTILNLVVFYKLFQNRISYVVLFLVLFIQAVNSYFIYYSSVTFTEQFFLFLQSLFLLTFYKAYEKCEVINSRSILNIKLWLLSAFVLFVMTLSRNVAIGALIPILIFFLFNKKWNSMLHFILAFLIFRVPFEIFRNVIWGSKNQFAAQGSSLILQKDAYDPSKGTEDFIGYVNRIFDNYGLYISKRFYQILGFLSENDTLVRPGLGFIFFVVAVICTVMIIRKKNNFLKLMLFYSSALTAITFVAVQKSWDQYRLILVFMPIILVLLFEPIFRYSIVNSKLMQVFLIIFFGVLIFNSTLHSIVKANANLPILVNNIKGDRYYGYTDDWSNFLKMSKWCGDNLNEKDYVASRKAPMSFIYANGKEFYPIYTVSSTNPDSVLMQLKGNGVTHVILASLRRNPTRNDGYIINTVHRMMQPIAEKYHAKLTLIKQIGESEPSYLYKINY